MVIRLLIISVVLLCGGCASFSIHQPDNPIERFSADVVADYRYGYQPEQLVDMLVPLAVAGTLANTQLDREIQSWQQDAQADKQNFLSHGFLETGQAVHNIKLLTLYSVTMLASSYAGIDAKDNPVAVWASRSARANLLGGPQALVLGYVLGSHRPDEGESDWAPFQDNNGVSGHAFYGAVPFLTAAHISESPGQRYTLYTLSAIPGIFRIYNNRHYTSQVLMGWSIAWLTTRNIAHREQGERDAWQVQVLPLHKGGLLVFSHSL